MKVSQGHPWSLGEALASLSTAPDLDALLERGVGMLRARTGLPVSAYTLSSRGDQLVLRAWAGLPDPVVQRARRLGQQVDVVWEVLYSGEPATVQVVADRLTLDFVETAVDEGLHWTTIVPLLTQGEPWGLLFVSDLSPPPEEAGRVARELGLALGALGGGLLLRARLGRSEALLAGVTQGMDEGVIVATSAGDVLVYNDALRDLVGWTLEEVRREGWPNLAYPDPSVRARAMASIRGLLLGQRGGGLWEVACKGGSTRTLRITSVGLADPLDGGTVVMGVMRDITDQHEARTRGQAASQARRFRPVAQAALCELCEGLQRGRERLRRGEPPGVEGLLRLVRGLRALGRPPVARVRAPLDLQALLNEAPALGLRVEGAERPPVVEADATLLRGALEHLEAAVRLGLKVQALHLRLAGEDAAGVRLLLTAGGSALGDSALGDSALGDSALEGVNPEATTLGAWVAAEPTASAQGGLELAVARAWLEATGGSLRPDGEGLLLTLPRSTRPLPPVTGHHAVEGGGDERVWVLDAEPALAEFMGGALSQRGYEVRVFERADELVAAVAGGAPGPQILVLDPILPGARGVKLVGELHSRGLVVPVLWVSAYAPEMTGVELDETMDLLSKPFSGADLIRSVRRLLDRRLVVRS